VRKLGIVCLDPSFDDETNDFSVFSWRTFKIPIAETPEIRSQRTKLFAFNLEKNWQNLCLLFGYCVK
jgi:hypothetical protein